MRIGIAKPDYGVVGGFELVINRICEEMRGEGHDVELLVVDTAKVTRRPFGIDIPATVWEAEPRFFRYLGILHEFAARPVDHLDVVLSTQPGSFAIDHPRHLSLFMHHERVYYDLSDVYLAAGFAKHPETHQAATDHIRRVDDRFLRHPQFILAGSEVVKDRLREFTGLEANVGVFHAGVGVPQLAPRRRLGRQRADHVLCVSRHEFPKRTELFVHAMKLVPELTGVAVGGGGRLPYVRALDARLGGLGSDVAAVDDQALWLCRHDDVPAEAPPARSNVRFEGHVTEGRLAGLFADALCVVAPAYLEDYGLTAIEAMHHGKPLVVCKDGGGLTTLVHDDVNGFVVEPTGSAVADAIRRLRDDPALARRLGEGARETAALYTWERAMREVGEGLARVLDR